MKVPWPNKLQAPKNSPIGFKSSTLSHTALTIIKIGSPSSKPQTPHHQPQASKPTNPARRNRSDPRADIRHQVQYPGSNAPDGRVLKTYRPQCQPGQHAYQCTGGQLHLKIALNFPGDFSRSAGFLGSLFNLWGGFLYRLQRAALSALPGFDGLPEFLPCGGQ